MTLAFRIEKPEICEFCRAPVTEAIYQHQCRPRIQKLSCFPCLMERGTCRYCQEPYNKLKLTDRTFQYQRYFDKPLPHLKILPIAPKSDLPFFGFPPFLEGSSSDEDEEMEEMENEEHMNMDIDEGDIEMQEMCGKFTIKTTLV